MQITQETVTRLQFARNLLTNEEAWIKGSLQRDENPDMGRPVCQHCLVGALYCALMGTEDIFQKTRILTPGEVNQYQAMPEMVLTKEAIIKAGFLPRTHLQDSKNESIVAYIIGFNDCWTTKHEEVLTVLDQAISLAQEQLA